MVTPKLCDVRPCSEPACRRVIFRVTTDARRDDLEKSMSVVDLCVNHYALTAVGRDLFELVGITVVEVPSAPAPSTRQNAT